MSRTESKMVELGTIAPMFEMVDVVNGESWSRDDVFAQSWDPDASDQQNMTSAGGTSKSGRHGMLLMFICVHCPFVKHVEKQLAQIGRDYEGRIGIAAISSNDITAYPEDSPEQMKQQAQRLGFNFPYLFDETQETARIYGAACTPDFFLFNAAMELVYRGQLDDSRPQRPSGGGNDIPVTGKDLRAAMDAVIAGKRPDPNQKQSIGCNIKWRE
jgi:thiol-disulfide isomerase/thioredoxin